MLAARAPTTAAASAATRSSSAVSGPPAATSRLTASIAASSGARSTKRVLSGLGVPDRVRGDDELHALGARDAPGIGVLVDVLLGERVDVLLGALGRLDRVAADH